jgi:hypothetical protein
MRGLELLSLSHPPEVRDHPELAQLSVQINQQWPSLPSPLPLEWTETPLVSIDSSGVPWVITPTERDPLRTSRGGTVIPRKQRAKLKKIADLGVPFQRLAIAHELDAEGPVRHLLLELNQGPRTCTDAEARALVGDVPPHPGVVRAVQALDVMVCGATTVVPAPVWERLLDPIIFGIIAPTPPPRQGQLCLWYPLAAWRW